MPPSSFGSSASFAGRIASAAFADGRAFVAADAADGGGAVAVAVDGYDAADWQRTRTPDEWLRWPVVVVVVVAASGQATEIVVAAAIDADANALAAVDRAASFAIC